MTMMISCVCAERHVGLYQTLTPFTNLTQIIYKIKFQTGEVSMTPSEICDRIFELVDQNHDGKKEQDAQ